MVAKRKNQKGQATIEMGMSLPFLVFLLYWTVNAYHSIHTAHVGQRYAAMNVYQRLNNRAKFTVDDVENRVIEKDFIAVRYEDGEGGGMPRRKILLTPQNPVQVNTIVGICREPGCN